MSPDEHCIVCHRSTRPSGRVGRQLVEIVGLLPFELESHSLNHYPKAERREIAEAVDPAYYQSSVWIAFRMGSSQRNHEVLTRQTENVSESLGLSVRPKGRVVVVILEDGAVS